VVGTDVNKTTFVKHREENTAVLKMMRARIQASAAQSILEILIQWQSSRLRQSE